MDAILNDVQDFIMTFEEMYDDIEEFDKVSMWVKSRDVITPSTDIQLLKKLKPGIYKVNSSREIGIFCKEVSFDGDNLFIFSNNQVDKLLNEVKLFWNQKDLYKSNNLIHKRGILLEGSPGSGKTSLIHLLSAAIVKAGGIVFMLDSPSNLPVYINFVKDVFRYIQPETPIITVIEDIDEYASVESILLDFLDGSNHVDHHLLIATTNDSTEISERLLRPSRIDIRVEIEIPSEQIRREFLAKKKIEEPLLSNLVDASDTFSFADLKEFFIMVQIFNYSIEDAKSKILNPSEKQNYNFEKSNSKSIGF